MMDFAKFHHALYGYEPFPWQQILADRVADGADWPQVVDLPTASGKTALIDIAVWSLAMQADRPAELRTAPRRIWFVVDRRIVVDEAYQRAERIASAIENNGKLSEVRDALVAVRGLGNGGRALAAARLRGGLKAEDGWFESITQPAVITSTVDQFGSRLLFRPYGSGPLSAAIHAALTSTDALLVLDEAHCAVPFMQTIQAVGRYQVAEGDLAWAERPIGCALRTVVMSATPPPGLTDVFPEPGERARALEHPLLDQRRDAAKPARLVVADTPKKPARGPRPRATLVPEAAKEVSAALEAGKRRIAVMLNRVDSAVALHAQLQKDLGGTADVVLLTGRLRPVDRNRLVDRWALHLRASNPERHSRPIVLCTTQCLEVGADFSFDALVSECASLDALRQRFGRMNRLGDPVDEGDARPFAAVLAWTPDTPGVADLDNEKPLDPIYGNALARTWDWLNKHAQDGVVDFGIGAMDALLASHPPSSPGDLLAPTPDAPVMLPAHVDGWCQTGPVPHVSADLAVFLHGPNTQDDPVDVVFRRDLPPLPEEPAKRRHALALWTACVQACPPLAGERLPVRRARLLEWLTGSKPVTPQYDVEGVGEPNEPLRRDHATPAPFVIYRGRGGGGAIATDQVNSIRPGDTVVLPAGTQVPPALGQGDAWLGSTDAYDAAQIAAGRAPKIRLNQAMISTLSEHETLEAPTAAVLSWLERPIEDRDESDLLAALAGLANGMRDLNSEDASAFAELVDRFAEAKESGRRAEPHPAGGLILIDTAVYVAELAADPFSNATDAQSLSAGATTLADHNRQVGEDARRMAEASLPGDLAAVVAAAAADHDLGKADPRFQGLLRRQPVPAVGVERLAKSETLPATREERDRLYAALGLPKAWRHEALSLRLAEQKVGVVDPIHRDLYLHLIAAHHGHARPFLPVVADGAFTDVSIGGDTVTGDAWREQPPHRLDDDTAPRFWRLTRRYGWWGLTYLESLVRLADWHASRRPTGGDA